jgi:WD40 repeat protein
VAQVTAELDLSQWGGRPRAAVFTVDGDVLVVSTKLGAITAWDVTKGALVAVLRGAGTANAPESIGWPGAHHLHAGPGVLVWSAHSRGHLRIWDTATWESRPLEV